MSRFIQLHVLTSYPPSNLNRDEQGRPKSAIVGGVSRLRVSSQSLKRAWRTSELFRQELGEEPVRSAATRDKMLGTRTKSLGIEIFKQLLGLEDITIAVANQIKSPEIKRAYEAARAIAKQFGALEAQYPPKKKGDEVESGGDDASKDAGTAEDANAKKLKALRKSLCTGQLFHLSPVEIAKVDALVAKLKSEQRMPEENDLELLRKEHHAVDIALFGRMLADDPGFNMEAATQVAHAFTAHKAGVEGDYFTAVDDLKPRDEDLGAAHIGEMGFGAGVYYLYICINRDLLDKNLGDDNGLRNRAMAALLHAVTKISPTGKQNSFASRAHASCVLAEKGDQQPRSLSLAFLKPVVNRNEQEDMAGLSIQALQRKRDSLAEMYGDPCIDWRVAVEGEFKALFPAGKAVSLQELITFVQAD